MPAVLLDGQVEFRVDDDAALVVGCDTRFAWRGDWYSWWSAPTLRTSDLARGGGDGVVAGSDWIDTHTTTFVCLITADTEADLLARIDAWKSATARSIDSVVTVRSAAFGTVRRRVGRFRIPGDVQVDQVSFLRDSDASEQSCGLRAVGSTQFVSLDGLTYGDDLNTWVTTRVVSGSGFTVPFTVPFTLGASTSGTLDAVNNGNAPAPWTARLDGPVAFPTITHLVSGRRLSLAFEANGGVELGVSDYLLIDSATRSVLLNGAADRRTQLTVDSDWWQREPGSNPFQFDADSGTGTLTVSGYDGYHS